MPSPAPTATGLARRIGPEPALAFFVEPPVEGYCGFGAALDGTVHEPCPASRSERAPSRRCRLRVLGRLPSDADGDAVFLFPIVKHSVDAQRRAEGFEVLL